MVNPWCDLCYEETRQKIVAEAFCPECNSFLCKSCIDMHKKVPASRKHKVQRGENMPKSQSDKPVKLQECDIHAENQCDYFCYSHDSMICDDCVQDSHQQCEAVNIVDLCKTLDHFDLQQLRDAISIFKKAAEESKISLGQNISKIESQKKVMIKEAEGVRDEIIRLIKHQFSQTITNIEEKCREKCCNLTKYMSNLAKAIQDLDETISEIDKTITTNIDPLNFIHFQDIAKRTQQQKMEIESLHRQLSKIELFFVTSSKTLAELGSFKYLGEVKEVVSESYTLKRIPDISFPLATRKKTEAMPNIKKEVQVTKLQPLMGKAPNNKMNCDITSMCVTGGGTLLLSDYNNGSTKVLSPEKGLLYSVSLSKKPLAIAKIDELTAAISTDDRKVHILDISKLTDITVKWSFHLNYLVSGMAPFNGHLVVVSKRKQPCIVKLIDIDGHELWSLSAKPYVKECFNSPESVATIPYNGEETILVTDSGNGNIRFINAVGDIIKTIDCNGKGPYGLTTDNKANVYVCCNRTNEIYIYSSDFQQRNLLLSASDLPSNPRYIVFCENSCVLYVSSTLGNTIARYELS